MGGERSIDLHSRPSVALPMGWHRGFAVLLLALLDAAALVIIARRLAGAFVCSLETPSLIAMGALLAALALVIRRAWFAPPETDLVARFNASVMILVSLAVVGLASALSLPQSPIPGKFALCLIVVAEESCVWALFHKRGQNYFAAANAADKSPPAIENGVENSSDPFALDVTQQLTRSRGEDGSEELAGWLRTTFAAGQRTGNVHIAFCPPFAATPELEIEQIDGPEARTKTAQVLPFGARIDLKLAATAETDDVVVLQFSARTKAVGTLRERPLSLR